MNLNLVAELMLVMGGVARNENIGAESLSEWLVLAGRALQSGTATNAQIVAIREQIETMVAQNRNPTPEEWAFLRGRSDAAHDAIQGWEPGPPAEK